MLRNGDRDCCSDAGVRLFGERILHTVHSCFPPEPEIAVDRGPEPRFEIVAQVPFNGPNWALRLGPGALKVDIARPEFGIRGEESHSEVPIEYPFALPALGITKFWFEGPTVGAPVD
jgi:hypothetical protein